MRIAREGINLSINEKSEVTMIRDEDVDKVSSNDLPLSGFLSKKSFQ